MPRHSCHWPRMRPIDSFGLQHVLRRRAPERHDHLRPDDLDLPLEVRRARRDLVRRRLAIVRRAALHDVRDEHLLALQAHRRDPLVRAAPPRGRRTAGPCRSSFSPGPSPMKKIFASGSPSPKTVLRARLAQPALRAAAHLVVVQRDQPLALLVGGQQRRVERRGVGGGAQQVSCRLRRASPASATTGRVRRRASRTRRRPARRALIARQRIRAVAASGRSSRSRSLAAAAHATFSPNARSLRSAQPQLALRIARIVARHASRSPRDASTTMRRALKNSSTRDELALDARVLRIDNTSRRQSHPGPQWRVLRASRAGTP